MTNELEMDSQDIESPVENELKAQEPKLYDSATVSKVIERERLKAYEKAKRDLQMQMEQQAQSNEQMPQNSNVSPDDIGKMIAEQLPQHVQNHIQQEQNKQAIATFVTKMQAAEARYPGLEAKLNDLDYDTMSPVVMLANSMDNTGDIMAELVNHPMKMANLMTLIYTQPKLAQREMQNLSNSIKQNQTAVESEQSAQKPITQTKPSSSSGKNEHDLSLSEIRRMQREY